MIMQVSEIYIDVIQAYEEMQVCLQKLKFALQADAPHMAWLHEASQPRLSQLSHRERAYAVISSVEYEDGQAPKEILVCPGIIGASPETLAIVNAVNQAKEKFKQTVLILKRNKINLNEKSFLDSFNSALPQREGNTSKALKKMGLARLHLKQCYRKIPILAEVPLKITWTWAHTRSIRKIDKLKAKALLEKRTKDLGIQQQLQNLDSIATEEPLAIVQELAPHLRANILFPNQQRIMVKGPIPIFFPAEHHESPIFKPPGQKKDKDKNRVIRADLQIDPELFLPAIHAHRYLSYSKK
jgi:hypothetical protein